MRRLIVHIFCRRLGLLQPPMSLRPLFADDGVPGPEIFLRFLQQTQAATFLNVLNRSLSALQTLDALHPVDGLLVEYPTVAAVALTGQQPLVRIEPQCMLRDAEHFRHLLDGIMRSRASIFA